jgi:hypothetical protein
VEAVCIYICSCIQKKLYYILESAQHSVMKSSKAIVVGVVDVSAKVK